MKKKIISICAALALTAGALPATAADIPDKVEITFKVGDSVLTVNGNPLEVTAPYVVGDGTTLVPVRVITEAFGAEVNWDGATQSVNLKYPDVDITIQIGSTSAQVNTHTEELLAAPELYQDTTMVPLRFISETFGAKVDYNDGLITVTKETAAETSSTVEGMSDKEFIGDSFHGWTMKNPKSFKMTERSFDGTDTEFATDDKKNYILISIGTQEENYDIDTEYNTVKNSMSDRSISAAEKKQMTDGYTQIHFRSKGNDNEIDIYEYIKGNKKYSVLAGAEGDSSILNEVFSISESFSLSEKRDFHDLSNVKDGIRSFKDDEYSFSLELPAAWFRLSNIQPNLFVFRDPDHVNTETAVGIYSKSDTVSARGLAEADRQRLLENTNNDLVKISELSSGTLSGADSCFYTAEYNGYGVNKYYMKDSYIELGDYVYNITVRAASSSAADKALSSFTATAPDPEKLGKILRISDIGGTTKLTLADGRVSASSYWQNMTDSMLRDARSESMIIVSTINDPDDKHSPLEMLNETADMIMSKNDTADRINNVKNVKKDDILFYIQDMKEINDDYSAYFTLYSAKIKNKIYIFEYFRDDVYYGGSIDEEAEKMITEFTIN